MIGTEELKQATDALSTRSEEFDVWGGGEALLVQQGVSTQDAFDFALARSKMVLKMQQDVHDALEIQFDPRDSILMALSTVWLEGFLVGMGLKERVIREAVDASQD